MCTAGFNWRKWGTTEQMGSTAEHCYEDTGSSNWYNGSAYYGQRYYFNKSRDAMLIRSSPSGSYNNAVFVGGPSTNDIRLVTSASGDVASGVIAFGGGVSNYNSGTIKNATFYASGKGPYRLTSVHTCVGGDSGGPWLTAHSNLTINAMGQHGGYYSGPAGAGCAYMPVVRISAALSASVMH